MAKLIVTRSEIDIEASPSRIIEVLFDYENYASYVPYCKWAKILEKSKDNCDERITVELKIALYGISNIETVAVNINKSKNYFHARQVKGALKHLEWDVEFEQSGNVTRVISTHRFAVGFSFIGKMLGYLVIGPFFVKKTEKLLLKYIKEYIERSADLSC